MKNRKHARRGGFTLIVVVGLIAFAATAVAAISTGFAAEARRTVRVQQEAQLRELLLAGAVQAQAMIDRTPPESEASLQLPASLTESGAAVRIKIEADPVDPQIRHAVITAAFGAGAAEQRVSFRHGDVGWRMIDARWGK